MSKHFDKDLLRQYMLGGASPSGNQKYSSVSHEIDLHIYEEKFVDGKRDEKYAIEYQLEAFEKAIDAAIAQGKSELRIIHGIGKGKLKGEIHKLLKQHPSVASFDDSYNPKYGNGSTLVYFF